MIDLILKLAQENVACNFNYNAGIKLLQELLPGATIDIIHGLLKGNHSIEIIDQSQIGIILDVPNKKSLNIEELLKVRISSIRDNYNNINNIVNQCLYNLTNQDIKLSLDLFLDLKENGVEALYDDYPIIFQYCTLEVEFQKDLSTLNSIKEIISKLYPKNTQLLVEVNKIIYIILDALQGLREEPDTSNNVNTYIVNTLRLNALTHIEPTTDYCDAGYFAPNGDYYGLNGEVANFIHFRIADLLQESGIIPENTGDLTKESWLEHNGWAKQHDHIVMYYGYYYDIPLTNKQIIAIKKILSQKFTRIDLQKEGNEIPVGRLTEIDNIQLRKHFS